METLLSLHPALLIAIGGLTSILLSVFLNHYFRHQAISLLIAFIAIVFFGILIIQSHKPANDIGQGANNLSLLLAGVAFIIGGILGLGARIYHWTLRVR